MGDSNTNELNFGFGFDDMDFSDRVLRLEVMPTSDSNMSCSTGEKYDNWFSSIHANDSEFGTTDFKFKTLHISSLLLAARSPFFLQEETAFMDLLNFIYQNTLGATSAPDLLDVLMAADKFEVNACTSYCIQLLLNQPISTETALLYLQLPSSVLEGELVRPLTATAKQHLAVQFKDFTKSQEELMGLPLCAIESVLGSDGLRVDSEDDVYDFILKWARLHYPRLGERREILTNHLTRFIHFSNMTCSKMKEAVECPDFDYEQVSKLVLNALFSKDEHIPTTKDDVPRRVYPYHPIKVVRFECAQPRFVVYFNLKKEECEALSPSQRLYSQPINLGGHLLSLWAERKGVTPQIQLFGLYLKMTRAAETCMIDVELSIMRKFSKELVVNSNNRLSTDNVVNMFDMSWSTFMYAYSDYFIDGILHFRVQLTINN